MLQTLATGHYNRRRKGVGNIVATIVFVFLLLTTVSQVYLFSFNLQDDYITDANERLEATMKKMGEDINISGAYITSSSRLNLSVTNNGGETAHLVSLWLINSTDHYRYSIDTYVSGGKTVTDIGSSIIMTYGSTYSIRIITERGNLYTAGFYPFCAINPRISLDVSPISPSTKSNVTVTLSITNNVTSASIAYGLTPSISATGDINTDEVILKSGPSTTSIDYLLLGESVEFTWVYYLGGDPDSTVYFNGTYACAPSGVFDDMTIEIQPSVLSVSGAILMDFKQIRWLNRSSTVDVGSWSSDQWDLDWELDKDDYLVWKINATSYFDEDMVLSNETALYFQKLTTSYFVQFFIVYFDEATGKIVQYNDQNPNRRTTLLKEEKGSIYFAVRAAGENPLDSFSAVKLGNTGSYFVILGIYGASPRYGQALPTQAIKVGD